MSRGSYLRGLMDDSSHLAYQRFYPVAEPDLGELEQDYVLDAVRSGWVSSIGRHVEGFETEFAAYCGAAHGISTCNGTAALHLALACLGIGAGDEVIVPALTFVATANAVAYTRATPVFVDSDPQSWCLDPEAVRRALTGRTRAIIAVHLYGHPADVDSLSAIASSRGIDIVEDAAEAHGAVYKGRRVGGIGRLGVFSFYGNKTITTGEGGMVVTNDSNLAERARFLRDHAMHPERRYWHAEIGFNYRMTNMQAALGRAQLMRIQSFLTRKRSIAAWYREELAEFEGGRLNPEMPWARNSYWLSCALMPPQVPLTFVMTTMRARGIDTRPFFYPLHTLPMYRAAPTVGTDGRSGLPVAEELSRRGLNLPSSTRLSRDDIRYIAAALRKTLAELPPAE